MECTEVKVHTQNIKPRECVCVCSKQGGGSAFISGIRHLGLVFANKCLGIQFDCGI